MKNYLFFSIICLPLLFSNPIKGQEKLNNLDHVYGMNPKLYNGRIYSDFYNSKVKGHQFLVSPDFSSGSLMIDQNHYENLNINYDVYKQKLLLSFKNYTQAHKIIELPLSHVQSFTFLQKQFRVITMLDSSLKIFQIIGAEAFSIFVYWEKEISTTTSTSAYDYQFSKSKKKIWVFKDHEFQQITHNKSLIKIFPKKQASDLKIWMKAKGIRIQKASDQQLELLAEYLYKL